jgi:hypothetical protein
MDERKIKITVRTHRQPDSTDYTDRFTIGTYTHHIIVSDAETGEEIVQGQLVTADFNRDVLPLPLEILMQTKERP